MGQDAHPALTGGVSKCIQCSMVNSIMSARVRLTEYSVCVDLAVTVVEVCARRAAEPC